MLTSHRKQLILSTLAQSGQVLAKALAEELGTSEDSIRRDLRELAAQGKLQRVHGGALPVLQESSAAGDTVARSSIGQADKAALGKLAASLVKPGQLVLLDGGTTALQVAMQLPADLRATVASHSPEVALALANHAHIEVLVLGGKLFRHSMVNMGPQTIAAVRQLRADIFFMGVTGVHPTAGLTTGDFEEAGLKAAFMAQAIQTVVLASSEKLMAASAYRISAVDATSHIAVLGNTATSRLDALTAAGAKLLLA